MGSEAAREQMVKGRKKLSSWFAFGSKYEDAAEMFSKAANLFKVAKNCALPARESVAKLHAHPPARATGDEAAEAFYEIAQCHLKLNSAHEAAEAYKDAAVCYKKTNLGRAIEHYKEAVQIHIDTGKFTTAAKLQKEIAELYEAESNLSAAMEGFQQAADYYAAEDATSQQSQCLLKVAGFAAQTLDYKKAIELYEQVAMTSLESTLLKWSVKDYYLRAGICHLATGDIDSATRAYSRYAQCDATFESTREGTFLKQIVQACLCRPSAQPPPRVPHTSRCAQRLPARATQAYEALDAEQFTDLVQAYDEVSRLDPQKTTLLLVSGQPG